MSKGMKVMIDELFGRDYGGALVNAAIGKKITKLAMVGEELNFEFEDNSKLTLFDDGQSCCESRYMQTDDNLEHFVGAKLQNVEIRDVDDAKDDDDYDGEVHEVQFLIVTTDQGSFTMANHVEHNGYYGGFSIAAREGV